MSIFDAFKDLNENTNIICKSDYQDCMHCATTKLDEKLEEDKNKIGYAYWTESDETQRIRRNVFHIGFCNREDQYETSSKDIAEIVCDRLFRHNVIHVWSGDMKDKIVIYGEGGN